MKQYALVGLFGGVSAAAPKGPLTDFPSQLGYDPVADQHQVVTSKNGNYRITVLTDHVLRFERKGASGARFDDEASIAVVNRHFPGMAGRFTHSETSNGVLTVSTTEGKVTLTVDTSKANATFSAQCPECTITGPAAANLGNLFGTTRALDGLCVGNLNCSIDHKEQTNGEGPYCSFGTVSRDGFAVINDTQNFLLPSEGWFGVDRRLSSAEDSYFFGHGMDYKAALRDYAAISGRTPLVPRPAVGTWFTRWMNWDDQHVKQLIDLWDEMKFPISTHVLDMDWHTKQVWGGYSWDRDDFPLPAVTIQRYKDKGIMNFANIHDASGIPATEERYEAACTALAAWPNESASRSACEHKKDIPYQPLSQGYMQTLQDVVLNVTGFDNWWPDWQQHMTGFPPNTSTDQQLNSQIIGAHVHSTGYSRNEVNKRQIVLNRWGGTGHQRYAVGFTGDCVFTEWKCFRFRIFMSATAANVNHGISHDMTIPLSDVELGVRRVQVGAFSSVMRIHDRGTSTGEGWPQVQGNVEYWRLPFPYWSALRAAVQERTALMPYIYNAARDAFDTGLQLMRSMYIDFPQEAGAYRMTDQGDNAQFMFGDDMFVSPVTEPGVVANNTHDLPQSHAVSTKTTWVPPGVWFDEVFGDVVTGPKVITRQYLMDDIPRFVRSGAVIPRHTTPERVGMGMQPYTDLDLAIYAVDPKQGTTGSVRLYEDDGHTMDYLRSGTFSWTNISYHADASKKTITVTIGAASNAAATGVPTKGRNVRLVFPGSMPATSVNGNVGYQMSYDGQKAQAVVALGGSLAVNEQHVVTITFAEAVATPLQTAGVRGYASRGETAKILLDQLDNTPRWINLINGNLSIAGYLKLSGSQSAKLSVLGDELSSDASAKAMSDFTVALSAYRGLVESAYKFPVDMYPNHKVNDLMFIKQTQSILNGSINF